MRAIILVSFVAGLLIVGKGIPEPQEKSRSITPVKKGTIGEQPKDSINYKQHPHFNCTHRTWDLK